MDGHGCQGKWDPQGKALQLTTKLNQKTTQLKRGWAVRLADPGVHGSLLVLKIELEHALGSMPGGEGTFQPGGTVVDPFLKPAAESISDGLRQHSGESDHEDATHARGQFGWITVVDPLSPTTVLDNLMQAVRDCADHPPGGGNRQVAGRTAASGAAKRKPTPKRRKARK